MPKKIQKISRANQREDVWNRTLLYNADLRLKSRQQGIKEPQRPRFRKQTLAYYAIVIALLIFIFIFLSWFVAYDVSKYASVFSATIQGVSTIFALVAAGTLLLVERVVTHSPRSLSYLPAMWVTGIFTVFITIITLDVVTMLTLPNDSSSSWLINSILVLNIASITLSAFYVKGLLKWLRPENVFRILREKAEKTKSKEEASEIVGAVRELAIGAVLNHDSLNTQIAIDTCEHLSSIFCRKWSGEDPRYDTNHPVRLVARCVESIGTEAILADMNDVGDACIEALCSMAFHHYDNQIHIDAWIFGTMQNITKALMKKERGLGSISTIIMEAKVAIDQDKSSLTHWLTCIFDELARKAGAYKDLEAARTLTIGIEILAEVFSKKATSVHTIRSFRRAIHTLEKLARDKAFGSFKGYFGERGWARERTISDILKNAKNLIETAEQKAFLPDAGDWPTPA